MTDCERQVQKSLIERSRFVPRCKRDGSYEAVQCDTATADCWCVGKDGNELPDTRSKDLVKCPGQGNFFPLFFLDFSTFKCCFPVSLLGLMICTSSFLDDPLTACQQQYQERWRKPVKGRAVPLCMPDGSYSKLQCYLSTCYCVDENGIQLRGTSVNALRDGLPFCRGDPGQSSFVSHIRPFKQFLIYFSAGIAPAIPA